MTRKSWDEYFLDIADMVATRATCPRLHVGAVLVLDKRIIATGYNGSYPGEEHCDDAGCIITECAEHGSHCIRTLHAEDNVLRDFFSRHNDSLESYKLYCTHHPCTYCMNILLGTGLKKENILWRKPYRT